jgi:hypothetical protein
MLNLEPESLVELSSVDISPYKTGNVGVDYITTFDSGEPGLHVMIVAVVHGNELCGAITLDHFMKNEVRPIMGKLSFAFANPEAYLAFDVRNPWASRWIEEDMNRVWGEDVLNGDQNSLEVRRARDMCPILDQVDMLLDLHSMDNVNPAMMMIGAHAKGQQLARDIATPEFIISDKGHSSGKRLRDYGEFDDPLSGKNALLLGAGQHWEEQSKIISIDLTLRFLKLFGSINMDTLMDDHLKLPDDQGLIEVSHSITITTDDFKWSDEFIGLECFQDAGSVVGWDGGDEVCTPYDDCILVMPTNDLRKGQTAVRFGKQIK